MNLGVYHSRPIPGCMWTNIPNLFKGVALKLQLEWAAKNRCLQRAGRFLPSLREDEWHHLHER